MRLGLFCKGGITGLAKSSSQHVSASRLFNAVVRAVAPCHTWTSMSISMDNGTQPHYDRRNATDASLLVGLSNHCQGQLWIQSYAGDTWMEEDDVRYLGVQHETTARAILFDSRRLLHGTMPWTGNRCVLIA